MKLKNANFPIKKMFLLQLWVKKVMLIVFWDMKGLINIDCLEKRASVSRVSNCSLLNQNSPYLLNKLRTEYIIIIIMSHYQHGYLWPTLVTSPYRPLLPAGLQDYIPYLYRAAVRRFELVVLPFHVHVKGSTGVHHWWTRPYFSSNVPHVWFV